MSETKSDQLAKDLDQTVSIRLKERCVRLFKWLLFFLHLVDIVYGCEELAILVYLFFYHYDYFISNMPKVLFTSGKT